MTSVRHQMDSTNENTARLKMNISVNYWIILSLLHRRISNTGHLYSKPSWSWSITDRLTSQHHAVLSCTQLYSAVLHLRIKVLPAFYTPAKMSALPPPAVKEKEDLHPDMESQGMNDDTFCEYRWALFLLLPRRKAAVPMCAGWNYIFFIS